MTTPIAAPPTSRLAWGALALGVLAIIVTATPAMVGLVRGGISPMQGAAFAIPVSIMAIVAGIIAVRRRATPRGAAITGIVLGGVQIAAAVVVFLGYLVWVVIGLLQIASA